MSICVPVRAGFSLAYWREIVLFLGLAYIHATVKKVGETFSYLF